MELELQRYAHGPESSGGLLFVDGEFFCHTCEDEHREQKVFGSTRIPPGRYPIKLRNAGGMNQNYSARFPSFHRGMLHLQNVPGFEWIYIHVGNTHQHTDGCILVGLSGIRVGDEYRVGSSVDAYSELYKKVVEVIDSEDVHITVVDQYRLPSANTMLLAENV